MDSHMYMAAKNGNIDPIKNYVGSLHQLVTPAGNTILHLFLSSPNQRSTSFVKGVLEICPSLLLQKNDVDDDIPLHIAARYGQVDIVEVLIEAAKAHDVEHGTGAASQMVGMTNARKQTALHEAARNCEVQYRHGALYAVHPVVVEVLAKEDPDFPYSVDDCGETPLYIAADGGNLKAVNILLNTCTSLAHSGPNGKTALHAAVMGNYAGIVDALLQKKRDLAIEVDDFGWTPLHYAAYAGFGGMVKKLLKYDKNAAYIVDNDGKRTALHLAAFQGNTYAVRDIINECPDSCKITDTKGWNFAHYAAISKYDKALGEVLEDPANINLIKMKDSKGNTALHLFVASFPSSDDLYNFLDSKFKPYHLMLAKDLDKINKLFSFSPQLKEENIEWMKDVGNGPFGQITFTLKEHYESKTDKAEEEEDDPELKRTSEVHILVAVLIATVTFAAAFTLPGGLKGDKDDTNRGSPVLSKSSAFQAFVVTDALAFVLSTSCVVFHFLLALFGYKRKYNLLVVCPVYMNLLAMATMVIAFVTGTYAVLAPSLGLAIVTCFIGLAFFAFFVLKCSALVKLKST